MKTQKILIKIITLLTIITTIKTLEEEFNSSGEEKDDQLNLSSICNQELIESYHLFPFEENGKEIKNPICPYIKNDCCALSSQKMIQNLWGKISQPRLQRQLTRNLSEIEKILNHMKNILNLYKNNILPKKEKYSAECLTSIDLMSEFVDENLSEKFEFFYEEIKEKFDILYKFKKQFYCTLCDSENQNYFKIYDKFIYFDLEFCHKFSEDFKNISWFLNYELIKYFQTIRNYILCYRDRNYLLIQNLYKFVLDRKELKDIAECRDNHQCLDFCNRYDFTDLPDIFIGKIDQLEQMSTFLEENKADDRGFIKKFDSENPEEGEEGEEGAEGETKNEVDFEGTEKVDFFKDASTKKSLNSLEEIQWEFYKNSFDLHRKRSIKKQMLVIREKVKKEFSDITLYQNFLTINEPKLNLETFHIKFQSSGINFYTHFNKEKLFTVNSFLDLYIDGDIDNTINELKDMNETDILDKIVDTTKLIKEGKEGPEDMQKFLENKIFDEMEGDKNYLVEDPFVEKSGDQEIVESGSIFGVFFFLVFFTFN